MSCKAGKAVVTQDGISITLEAQDAKVLRSLLDFWLTYGVQ